MKKGDGFIEIKIIGSNCSLGRRLMKQLRNASDTYNKDIVIKELNRYSDKVNYHVNRIPALLVDDKIISQGKVLGDNEIKKLIFKILRDTSYSYN